MKTGSQGFAQAERKIEVDLKYARSDLAHGAQVHRQDQHRLCRFVVLPMRRPDRPSARIQNPVKDILVPMSKAQTQYGLLASEDDSAATEASSISALCTVPVETRFKNLNGCR